MAIYELYSKRLARDANNVSEIYNYGSLSKKIKMQIIYIMMDVFGGMIEGCFNEISRRLCREYGELKLSYNINNEYGGSSIARYLGSLSAITRELDLVELSFNYMIEMHENGYNNIGNPFLAISDLNERFKENMVGYRFESSRIIRIDSEYAYTEMVKPTISLLNKPYFQGANQEFLSAHEHYVYGRYKECIVDANKAFESTMKAVCDKRGWKRKGGEVAAELVKLIMKNHLLPEYLHSQMGTLANLLISGLPEVRNKTSAHGQGSDPVNVKEHFARFALHQTATNILFIAEADMLLEESMEQEEV
ncbi:MAG: abortive infection family protein [Magnetococcales bacterium]|nr:hypothetical protein [Magnetococcales bacterium]NGZ26916.1 abortive infection family protein [Magnetococcales bacterium]